MNEHVDPTALARRLLNLFPKLRDIATATTIVAMFLYSLLSAVQPTLAPLVEGHLLLYPVDFNKLFWTVLALLWAASTAKSTWSIRLRKKLEFDDVVDKLEYTMAKAQYSKAERKLVWRTVVDHLVRGAKLDGSAPPAAELATVTEREMEAIDQSRVRS